MLLFDSIDLILRRVSELPFAWISFPAAVGQLQTQEACSYGLLQTEGTGQVRRSNDGGGLNLTFAGRAGDRPDGNLGLVHAGRLASDSFCVAPTALPTRCRRTPVGHHRPLGPAELPDSLLTPVELSLQPGSFDRSQEDFRLASSSHRRAGLRVAGTYNCTPLLPEI